MMLYTAIAAIAVVLLQSQPVVGDYNPRLAKAIFYVLAMNIPPMHEQSFVAKHPPKEFLRVYRDWASVHLDWAIFGTVCDKKLDDGSSYQGGCLRNGLFHSSGIHKDKDGNVYVGKFFNGTKHGKGFYQYASGEIYEGNFKGDKKHGWGVSRYEKNGDFVLECWNHGRATHKVTFEKERLKCGGFCDTVSDYVVWKSDDDKVGVITYDSGKKYVPCSASGTPWH